MKLIPANEADKKYFEDLNEIVYKDLVERQFGSWNSDFERDKFSQKWEEQDFKKIITDDQVVGGVWIQVFDSHHQLREIQIHPDFQNRGIGTQIVRSAISIAKKEGKELRLRVLLTNPAVKLYERLGFIITEKNDVQYHMVISP